MPFNQTGANAAAKFDTYNDVAGNQSNNTTTNTNNSKNVGSIAGGAGGAGGGGNNRVYAAGQAAGGRGGHAFDDTQYAIQATGTRLSEIRIRSGIYIDAIQLVFSLSSGTSTAPWHGGSGGYPSSFVLQPGEYIVKIDGRAAAYIDQLRFTTNTGRQSQVFGGNGGSPFTWTNQSNLPSSGLAYFTGRSGIYVDYLQPHFFYDASTGGVGGAGGNVSLSM
ncbi:hypothetical protein AX17_002759 [Amanita inopinata Kibby_2008]|nr:hypothetical protein AX17_002759 [Amanita inopinata Kibby_2008]